MKEMSNYIPDNQVVSELSAGEGSFGLRWYGNTTDCQTMVKSEGLEINDLQIEGIDYLQIYGKKTTGRKSKRFKVVDLEQSTRLYKKSFLVTDEVKNMKVCVMNCEPSGVILPEKSVSIKFDNAILYMKFFNNKYLRDFFRAISFNYKYISRLDIYRDFQKFKDFDPELLICNYMNKSFLHCSRTKFTTVGVDKIGGLSFQYLRIGMKSSGRQFYLYNKSVELEEVGVKEHVVQTWFDAGFNQAGDVWRLELSLSRRRSVLVNEEDGEILDIDIFKIFRKRFINLIYEAGLRSLFSFVKSDNVRKARCTKIKLFTSSRRNIRLNFEGYQCDGLRMRKVIVGSMIKDMLRETETREHRSRSIEEQIEAVNGYVIDNNMDNHLIKILQRLAIKYKCDYYSDLSKFIYNYWAKLAGY